MACIIIDGPDRQGKTTLAEAIARQTQAIVLHCGYRFRQNMFAYHTAVVRQAWQWLQRGRVVVIDRHWLSEVIYADVYRGGTQWPLEGRYMARIFKSWGALNVLALTRNKDLALDVDHDAALGHNRSAAARIHAGYAKVLDGTYGGATYAACIKASTDLDWMHYDYTEFPGDRVQDAAAAFVAYAKRGWVDMAEVRQLGTDFCGNPSASDVVIATYPDRRRGLWPGHSYSGEALKVCQHLHSTRAKENCLGWIYPTPATINWATEKGKTVRTIVP